MQSFTVALVTKQPDEIPAWVAEALGDAGIRLMVRRCTTPQELLDHAGLADALWTVGANTCITADLLPRLPRCRALLRSGSGLDDLPVAEARALGWQVLSTPEAIAEAVAEHAVAMLLALVRQLAGHDRAVRRGEWDSSPAWARWQATGGTLGLIGFGLIAREVVRMVAGFRMRVIAHDPHVDPDDMRRLGVTPVSLDELLRRSDFVSVHCPLSPATRHLLGAAAFAALKPGAILVNTSRGGVIDEAALLAALREGRVGAAALDVLEQEPPAADHPLLRMENVLVSPHVAAFADGFERRFWQASITKLAALRAQNSHELAQSDD
jgi:phosphoglycerate dehydrogenase-like enzyme